MGKNKEYELAIKIAGEVEKSFYESMRLSKKELQAIAEQAAQTTMRLESTYGKSSITAAGIQKNFSKSLKDTEPFFSGLESAAKTAFDEISKAAMLAGAGITTGLVASVHVGSEFESAFAGVKKTVNASNAELEQMRDSIRGLAKEMPSTAAELSAIAESAGQLGIHNENIMGFTRTMADLDVSTDLGDSAAADFAKFANITGMDQGLFSNMGSSVVALGNNMATQESNIVDMSMRIAAAGDQIGLSEANILGYSAALSSVGIEAEAGGTAFSKLLTNLQLATETGKKLDDYASVAGMTGQKFKETFQNDATEAINAFLVGLTNTEQNGKSAIAVLDEMGLTEVRLRDTLLRAGNASDLFANALEISNTAWEENTALANEAEQRYKTFESQCQMTQNKLTDIGITVYDDLRPALTEGIGLVNGFIDGFADQNRIGEFIESATKEMPTMARKAKEAGEALSEFADPFLKVGGWLVDNPGVITGTIAGVGTALGTYKIASGVMSLTKALGSLNPVGMGIMALGGTAAVITGISTAVKKAAAEAKQANLDAHFGDISLSISELEETAAAMIQSQGLDQIRESIMAMGEVDRIADDIRDAKRELDKMNWKVSVGMELTESEQEAYQEKIESFVNSTQAFVTEQQYAVNLAVGVLTDDDLEGRNIVNQINEFYSGKTDELANLGTQMNEAITDAFNDGLLEIPEIEKITELQNQMANIQNSLTGAEYNANLELMKSKYSMGDLDAESFRNLQAELQEQIAAASADYEKSFVMSVSNADIMLKEGEIDQKEYENWVSEFRENYMEYVGDLQAKAASFQTQAIMENYSDVFGSIDINEKISEELENTLKHIEWGGNAALEFDTDIIYKDLDLGLDKDTKAALSELWEDLAPQLEQMNQTAAEYREAGMEIPASLSEGINDAAIVGAMVGDRNALYTLMGEEAQNSEEYQEMLKSIQEQGIFIPEEIANAIADNQQLINDAVDVSFTETQEMLNQTYGKGFDVTAPINVTMPTTASALTAISDISVGATAHKDGGIFTQPHLGLVAEAGYPESIIPINNSPEAIDLWLKTGELLGMDGLTGGAEPLAADIEEAAYSGAGDTVMQIDNSRTIYFYGDAPSKEELEDVLESEDEKFAQMMDRYLANGRRTRFY